MSACSSRRPERRPHKALPELHKRAAGTINAARQSIVFFSIKVATGAAFVCSGLQLNEDRLEVVP